MRVLTQARPSAQPLLLQDSQGASQAESGSPHPPPLELPRPRRRVSSALSHVSQGSNAATTELQTHSRSSAAQALKGLPKTVRKPNTI